jgi:hypothetical protein
MGVNNEHIAVIVTQDRKDQVDLTVATAGRLKKIDLENAIGQRFTEQTVLCTDSHVSYKGSLWRTIEWQQKERIKTNT